MKKVSISITQKQPNGSILGVEIEGKVKVQEGSDEEVARILLEAGQHGNNGKPRIHIFVKEK